MKMGLIERLLCFVFKYQDIKRDDTGELYLRRFFVQYEGPGQPRVMLHKFYRGDEDPHLHDHPWGFTSFIITRGYWEETPFVVLDDNLNLRQLLKSKVLKDETTGEWRRRVFYPRFSKLVRPAEWKHRVILKDPKPVWTLVWSGPKVRDWGFWIKDKLCPWNNYQNGICWCGPEDPPASNT